jgi:hypothetical protein
VYYDSASSSSKALAATATSSGSAAMQPMHLLAAKVRLQSCFPYAEVHHD